MRDRVGWLVHFGRMRQLVFSRSHWLVAWTACAVCTLGACSANDVSPRGAQASREPTETDSTASSPEQQSWGADSGDGTAQNGTGDKDLYVDETDYDPLGADVPARADGCGDTRLTEDEACDDGNNSNGDGCAADCLVIEQGYDCAPGERCELVDICGDGRASGVETCDDANDVGGDGCSALCFVERDYVCIQPGNPCTSTVVCGDGRISGTETCDDGDLDNDDGCSAQCTLEGGYECAAAGFACRPACGDGLLVGDEGCDDGNLEADDGCTAGCQLEPGFACPANEACHRTLCGDGVVEGGEPCDDGSDVTLGDGCSPGCRLEPDCSAGECHSRCGDGLILAGDAEECDDGNDRAGDGCSAECQIEPGFSCIQVSDTDQGALSLPVVYRDFISRGYQTVTLTDGRQFQGHPDFDAAVIELKDMVEVNLAPEGDTLNAPHKPIYNADVLEAETDLVASRQSFNQWYADDPSVNMTFVDTMQLAAVADVPGTFEFDDPTFFPLDGRGFSDPDLALDGVSTEYLTGLCDDPEDEHAFLFTSELRYWFEYHGGEQLVFRGDDDVWVFIKNRLVVDLGGIHGALGGDVCGNTFHPDFPADCAGLGPDSVDHSGAPLDLEEGRVYEIAVFQAERRACQSSYRLTLSGFTRVGTECESTCGDGVVAGSERCDDGDENGAGYGYCTSDCQPGPRCGDGVVNGDEACDDGVNGAGYRFEQDSCAPGCVLPPYCGDGQIDAAFGEQCEPEAQEVTCTQECELGARCGDGNIDPELDEECDDGNRKNNDGCNILCKEEHVRIVR